LKRERRSRRPWNQPFSDARSKTRNHIFAVIRAIDETPSFEIPISSDFEHF
jgi:hypothetical protein